MGEKLEHQPESGSEPYVSTGRLPAESEIGTVLAEAHGRYATVMDGSLSNVYPALASAKVGDFGLCLAATDGRLFEVGDVRRPFTIMSVAKPFVFALIVQAVGLESVRRQVGVNATGLPFNSLHAVERDPGGHTNPMVNAGAIVTTGMTPGAGLENRWRLLLDGLSRFAGRELAVDDDVLDSARQTNHVYRSLAMLVKSKGSLTGDPLEAVELYTRQSCLSVTATDLALMGSTLADGGVQPVTGEHVVDPHVASAALAVMTIAGLYETSGDWLLDVGMPGKSGISGGIVTVAPGKGALGTYSPLLDSAGNSVRGQLVTRALARSLGLNVLASSPRVLDQNS